MVESKFFTSITMTLENDLTFSYFQVTSNVQDFTICGTVRLLYDVLFSEVVSLVDKPNK